MHVTSEDLAGLASACGFRRAHGTSDPGVCQLHAAREDPSGERMLQRMQISRLRI